MLTKRSWYDTGLCASDDPTVYLFCADLWANFAGPMGFGILFASMFMGVIAVLAGLYFVTKPRSSERAAIYWSVIATVTLCFAASLVEWTAFFRYYVVKAPIHDWDPGNVPFIPVIHVSNSIGIGAVIICQVFFGYRAYTVSCYIVELDGTNTLTKFLSGYYERLGKNTAPITFFAIFCTFCMVASNAAGIALMGLAGFIDYGKADRSGEDSYTFTGGINPTVLNRTEKGLYGIYLVGSAFVDLSYTLTLCVRLFLDRSATGISRTRLTAQKLFSYSLSTGLLTTIPAFTSVWFYYFYTYATIHVTFIVVLPKLYTICLLFTLLSRDSLSKSLNKGRGQGITLNLSSLPSNISSNLSGQPPSFRTEADSYSGGNRHLIHASSFEKKGEEIPFVAY